MANSKKLKKATAKFRKAEPALYELCSKVIEQMAWFINKAGSSEVTAVVKNGMIDRIYANE